MKFPNLFPKIIHSIKLHNIFFDERLDPIRQPHLRLRATPTCVEHPLKQTHPHKMRRGSNPTAKIHLLKEEKVRPQHRHNPRQIDLEIEQSPTGEAHQRASLAPHVPPTRLHPPRKIKVPTVQESRHR